MKKQQFSQATYHCYIITLTATPSGQSLDDYVLSFCPRLTYFYQKTEDYVLSLLFFTSCHTAYHHPKAMVEASHNRHLFGLSNTVFFLIWKFVGVWKCHYNPIRLWFRSETATFNICNVAYSICGASNYVILCNLRISSQA